MLKIGSFTLKSHVIQSPMAGCTDLAFRLLARSFGMEFAFLEMVSAHALVRENKKTAGLLKSSSEDRPLGAQLVGCNPDVMGEAASMIEAMGFNWLDLNLGCPVPKIVSPGAGSALMDKPEKAESIFKAVMKRVRKIPVTVKMRKGFNDPSGDEAVHIARIAEDAGFSAVTVHGRTRVQGYSGQSDWEAIGKVKKAIKIPVFGNGDVQTGEDAKRLIEISGCDGVMIGRGALGNPWIYQSIEAHINGHCSQGSQPSLEELKKTALRHMELEIENEGEYIALVKMRRIASWYFKNQPGAAHFRSQINQTQTCQEVRSLIENFGAAPV